MNFKVIYNIGSIILFLGMLWSFLPHAYHSLITQEDETEHYIHLLEGVIGIVLGLIIMIWSNRKLSKKQQKAI